jgi:hypothetical protein
MLKTKSTYFHKNFCSPKISHFCMVLLTSALVTETITLDINTGLGSKLLRWGNFKTE